MRSTGNILKAHIANHLGNIYFRPVASAVETLAMPYRSRALTSSHITRSSHFSLIFILPNLPPPLYPLPLYNKHSRVVLLFFLHSLYILNAQHFTPRSWLNEPKAAIFEIICGYFTQPSERNTNGRWVFVCVCLVLAEQRAESNCQSK